MPEPDHEQDEFEAAADRLNQVELGPGMEPLTDDEKEAFLARVRTEGRSLTSAEQYAIFGPPPEVQEKAQPEPEVIEMQAANLAPEQIAQLRENFFPEFTNPASLPQFPLVNGIIFDFDSTLAYLERPLVDLMNEGARNAEAYMRSTGMELPDEFWKNIVEARRFAHEKSVEEKEEHIADDAMSFLLQFYGYPASKMDPEVLHRAVDIFYASEMTAWRLYDGVFAVLDELYQSGYRLALVTNYNCDRVFQRSVDFLGLRRFFDIVLSSASVEYRKPDLAFFQIVLDRWGILPYETVIVGDSLSEDIQGGIDLGALTVFVQPDGTQSGTESAVHQDPQVAHDNALLAEQIMPDATIAHFSQLPAHIAGWTEA